MTVVKIRVVACLVTLLVCKFANAWGPAGHHTVGAIADRLIAGTDAATQVKALLDGLSLENAAVWADCAKGVDPTKGYAYTTPGAYTECKIFETPAGEAEMIDFVKRNDNNCPRAKGDESCHKQYHYTDDAIQHNFYHLGDVGTTSNDVVAAITAATHVLHGDPAPAPFSFASKREALLVLAHYVGDIHQPLHVGAVYLNAAGVEVNPEAGTFDPATKTVGANDIITVTGKTKAAGANLHHIWDQIPSSLTVGHINAAWIAKAKAVPATPGDVYAWPTVSVTQSLDQAQAAFAGLHFGAESKGRWTVALPTTYATKETKNQQISADGSRRKTGATPAINLAVTASLVNGGRQPGGLPSPRSTNRMNSDP